ncbi:MAG: NAD-dependent deacylase [Chloroflexi bacterium]|nr:NAD-dependent deacylase [Chloroflexota bacterium]
MALHLSPEDISLQRDIQRAAELIRRSRHFVAFTGAGISVPSGVPDFRSPGSGLWEHHDPSEVASIDAFITSPDRFYDWIRPLARILRNARPNPAHKALARLQALGYLHEIITQNVDGLQEAAGGRDVLAIHGHLHTATCLRCRARVDAAPLWDVVLAGQVPMCDQCGGVVKPDVILFGEMLPLDVFHRAEQAALRADLMLVAGSSLEVFPAADLPRLTLDHGGRLLIVNRGPTSLDHRAVLRIEGDVAQVLPAIADSLRS